MSNKIEEHHATCNSQRRLGKVTLAEQQMKAILSLILCIVYSLRNEKLYAPYPKNSKKLIDKMKQKQVNHQNENKR